MGKYALRTHIARRFTAVLAIVALAVTGQNFISVSASATEADSANSAIDYAGVFDGTTSNTVIANADTIIPASTAFTVEAWTYPTSNDAADRVIVSQGTAAGGQFWIKRKNGEIIIYRNTFSAEYNCGPTPVNAWTHVAVTMDGTNVNCYFDGAIAFTKAQGFGANIAAKFVVGSWAHNTADTNTYWKGQIDQVKVWSSALTEAQLVQSMHTYSSTGVSGSPTLLAHYDFNEGSNADATVYNRADANFDLTSSSALTYADVKTAATGGNIDSARTVVYKFPRTYLTAQGGWTVPENITSVEALAVGAGGGGGENVGAGGSGGSTAYHSGFALTSGSVMSVKVGAGGHPGVFVDDSMSGTTSATWNSNASLVANADTASAQRDGGDGQSSVLSVGSTTLTAPGGLGGQTYWDSNVCNGSGHTSGTTAAGAAATGGTTNGLGATGGASLLTGAGAVGGTSTNNYSISGSAYKYGAGGAGANGTNSPTAVAGGADGGGTASTTVGVRAGNGAVNSGSGGAGGNTVCTPGGAGGSGVVYIRTTTAKVNAITAGGGSTRMLSGAIAGPTGDFVLALSSTVGTLSITPANLTTSGATITGGSGSDKFITYTGTIAQLNAALAFTKLTLQMAVATGSIKCELNPVIADSGTTFFNNKNGHYYKAVTTTANWATAKSNAENSLNNLAGLTGYLSNVTSDSEKDFIYNKYPTTSTMWSGGYYNGTNWIWEGGPEAGTVYWSGIALGSAVAGQYANWGTGEPNSSQDRMVVNWTASAGVWDNQDSTVANNYLVEYGGRATDPGVASAVVTVTTPRVNVAFTELNFDYSAGMYANLKKLSIDGTDPTLAGSTITATVSTGKNIGDRVLFKSVTLRDGKTIDAVVTTRRVSGASVKEYEANTNAGGAATNFQADIDITGNYGFVEFQYDFYETNANIVANCNASITCAGATKVILENVNVSIIDIDYYQWADITAIESYTVSNPTNIKECLLSSITASTTCTARATISTFPADVRFQGRAGYDNNVPQDMAIVTYGSLDTFRIKFGRTASASQTNYYGIAFKALPWGSATPQTVGPPASLYNITYNGNGSTGGTVPATQTGAVGTTFTAANNTGSLAKTGYTFGGWNSAADGSGTAYAAGSSLLMPLNGMTLYAIWVPGQFTLSYNANGGSSAPASSLNNAGAAISLSSSAPTRSGYTFAGWNTLANGTGTNYAASAAYTMPSANTTLYAKWTAATASIAYNGNGSTGGTVPATATGTASATTTVSSNTGSLVKTGYTFAGWNTLANGTGTDYAASAAISYPASGTTTLYAQWTAVSYTVAYNSNGGTSAPASSSQLYGATVTVVSAGSNPTRSGYTFAGWNTAANGSGTAQAAASTFTMPGSNVTLYAQWTAINYNVTYNGNVPNGQSLTGSQTDATNYNAAATVTVANQGTLAVSGYRFVGWNTAADGSGTDYIAASTFAMPVGGITLYAKWVSTSITLTYDANGGTNAPPADTHTSGQSINLSSAVPTRAGYTFGGWNTAANGGGTNYASSAAYTVPGSNTILYAKWTAINYTLNYSANGGSGAPASLLNQIINTVISISATIPTWIGYTFLGWNTAANGTGTDYISGGSLTMPANDVTLYAKWQGNAFTLYYNGNGGSNISPSSEARSAGTSSAISSSVPTRSGYTFAGWNTAINGSGTSYSAGATISMPGSNLTLYAQWSPVNSAVTYDPNGGVSAPAGQTATVGQLVTISNGVPTRTGYTFLGWNTAANGSGSPYLAGETLTMGVSSVTLYAQWTTTAFSLTYDANGGAGAPGAANYSYAATVTVSSTVPTQSGYDFMGWNTLSNGTGSAYASASTFAMPANNVTLYAQWSLSTYSVYYNANGGSGSIASQAGRFNTSITLSGTSPTRSGYTFAGWNGVADGSGTNYASSSAFTIPASNTIMYAQWTAINYSLTYDANGGSGSPAALTGKVVGEAITLSATTPTNSGYYFSGWNTAANGTGQNYAASSALTMPAADVVLYAQWTLNTYSVSYNANGGSGAPNAQQTSGGNVTVPNTTPVRPGYTFTGWNTAANGSGTARANGATFAPGGNLVLYAQWSPNTITISYNINGGTGSTPANSTGTYGSVIQLAGYALFSRTNYVFVSWNTAADASGTNYQAEDINFALPTSSLTLYAIWSGTNYAIEYNPNGGSNAPSTQYATPGNNVLLAPSEPTRSGYDFTGWQEVSTGNVYAAGAPITMPTANMVMVARWITRASLPHVTPTPTPTPTAPVATPKKLTITVYFKGDSAVLTAATKTALTKLAVQAKKFGKATSITIIGRVKETNDKSYDMRLSKQRALNVAAFLKKLGVTGTYSVIAAGISPENKAISRRVDATLTWKN